MVQFSEKAHSFTKKPLYPTLPNIDGYITDLLMFVNEERQNYDSRYLAGLKVHVLFIYLFVFMIMSLPTNKLHYVHNILV